MRKNTAVYMLSFPAEGPPATQGRSLAPGPFPGSAALSSDLLGPELSITWQVFQTIFPFKLKCDIAETEGPEAAEGTTKASGC